MADASSIRKTVTNPTATGRNKGLIRYNTTTDTVVYANGTNIVTLGLVELPIRQNTNASVVTESVFTAGRAYKVIGITEIHGTLGTDAGAVTVTFTKDTGTQAAGAGTALITTPLSLKSTINTLQTGVLAASAATLTLAAGNRIAVKIAGVTTAVAGALYTITLQPL